MNECNGKIISDRYCRNVRVGSVARRRGKVSMTKREILNQLETATIGELERLNSFTTAEMYKCIYTDYMSTGHLLPFDTFVLISVIACKTENESLQFVQQYKRAFGDELYQKCNAIFVRCCSIFFETMKG